VTSAGGRARGGLEALAAFAATVAAPSLPPAVLEKARACLLYGLAVGIASAGEEAPCRAARAMDRETGGSGGPATRLLDGHAAPPGAAAFANGVLLHSRVQDDSHPAGHLGVVVLPAALAVGEAERCDGPSLLAGAVAGYEVALRIGRDHAAALSARGFRTTPAYGVIGAAAAASRLRRLDAARTARALALAANFAGGLREFARAGSGEYAVHAGIAARNGITAADLAAEGVEAAGSILEGPAGFFRAFGDAPGAGDRLAEKLGDEFEMARVTYKPYPICQFHRGVVRGALALRARAAGAALARLRVELHPFEAGFVGVRHAGPFRSFSETMMSAPFCAALAWTHGAVTLAGLTAFEDPAVLAAVPRVAVQADPARPRYRPRLAATLADGRRLEWEEPDGEDADRLTWPAAVEMAERLGAEAGLPPGAVRRLVDAVAGLEAAPGLDRILEAATAAAALARPGAAPSADPI
jgi:2-methylcitrate dehydratase PrpD